jgi:uncharacterized membrane protein YdjX (TVP38/TMEM64 family)
MIILHATRDEVASRRADVSSRWIDMIRLPAWIRALLLAVIACGIAAAIVYRQNIHPDWLSDVIGDYPEIMPVAYLIVHVAASLLFIPRMVMAVVAGGLFGFMLGGALSLVGAMCGALSGFWLARNINADLVRIEDLPRVGAFLARAADGGWRLVMVTRLLPVLPHALVNYVYGLSRIPFRDYLVGSFLGFVPQTIAFVKLGEAGAELAGGKIWWESLLWAGILLAGSLVLPRLVPQRWR